MPEIRNPNLQTPGSGGGGGGDMRSMMIFTALALILEFWLLRQIHAGHRRWAFALPLLFGLWINTHGGVLAGMMVLFIAAAGTTVQMAAGKIAPRLLRTRLALNDLLVFETTLCCQSPAPAHQRRVKLPGVSRSL